MKWFVWVFVLLTGCCSPEIIELAQNTPSEEDAVMELFENMSGDEQYTVCSVGRTFCSDILIKNASYTVAGPEGMPVYIMYHQNNEVHEDYVTLPWSLDLIGLPAGTTLFLGLYVDEEDCENYIDDGNYIELKIYSEKDIAISSFKVGVTFITIYGEVPF